MKYTELIDYLDSNSKVVIDDYLDDDCCYITSKRKIINSDKTSEASQFISRYIMEKLASRTKYIKEHNVEKLEDANNKIHNLLNYEFNFKE